MSGSTSPLDARAHGARRTARGRRDAASGFWARARRTTSRARASATSASVEARTVDIASVCARQRWIRGRGDVCGRGSGGDGDLSLSREIFDDARNDGRAGSYDWLCKTITGMLRALRGRGGVPLDPGWNTLVVVFVLVVVVDVVLGEGFFESVGGVRVRL